MSQISTPTKRRQVDDDEVLLTPSSEKYKTYNPWDVKKIVEDRRTRLKLSKKDEEEAKEETKFDIKSLSVGTYNENPLTVRVTSVDTFERGKKPSLKVFCLDDSAEIGLIFFDWDGSKFIDEFKPGGCVTVTNFKVNDHPKNATAALNSTLGIQLTASSVIEKAAGSLVREIPFRFKKLEELLRESPGSVGDVMVVVDSNWKMTGQGYHRRRILTITDETAFCSLTLWRWQAEHFGEDAGQILVLRNAVVNNFDDKNCLTATYFTGLLNYYEDHHPGETKEIEDWYAAKKLDRDQKVEAALKLNENHD